MDPYAISLEHFHYKSQGTSLEAVIVRPSGRKGNLPGAVFLHGHNSNCWDSVWIGYALARAGFAVFIPTQHGYPFSGGKRDFCGPRTVRGVLDGIEVFLKRGGVDREKVVIWGVSRGAKVAALAAIARPQAFRGAVFQSGGYDAVTEIASTLPTIRAAIMEEVCDTAAELRKRSPVMHIDAIRCPVLVLHGAHDDRIPSLQAEMLDEKMTALGKPHRTIIMKNEGHFLTLKTMDRYTIPFLLECARKIPPATDR